MMSSEFWDEYNRRVEELNNLAHHLAIRSIAAPGAQDWQELFDPGLLLDYSALLKGFMTFLADNQYTEGRNTFVNTASQGPVTVEVVDDGFYVYRFDRAQLSVEEVPEEDRLPILEAYRRIRALPL